MFFFLLVDLTSTDSGPPTHSSNPGRAAVSSVRRRKRIGARNTRLQGYMMSNNDCICNPPTQINLSIIFKTAAMLRFISCLPSSHLSFFFKFLPTRSFALAALTCFERVMYYYLALLDHTKKRRYRDSS